MADDYNQSPDWYKKANKARLSFRKDLVDRLDDYAKWLSGTHVDQPGGPHHEAQGEHADISRTLTGALNASGLPPIPAAGVAELGGYVNEGVTGGLQAILAAADVAKGRPVTHDIVGPAGWDPADIAENHIGQMQALNEGDKRAPWLRNLAQAQAGILKYAPAAGSLMPLGALERASIDTPRMAELGMRAWDAGSEWAGGALGEAAQRGLDWGAEQGFPGAGEAMRRVRGEPQTSQSGPYTQDEAKALMGALGRALAQMGLKK